MDPTQMQYHYVDINDKFISIAYIYAKNLYLQYKWNSKTIPVCLIIKDGKFISKGICSDGGHAIDGKCDRLKEAGTPYEMCKHCKEEEHAERKALMNAYDQDLTGAIIYLYGHYILCEECIKALNARGIFDCYLLENSAVLFDRHNKDTVLGKSKQFDV